MGRPRAVRPRAVVISLRVTQAEADLIDRMRGRLTRSEWVRWMLLRTEKGLDSNIKS